MALSIYKPGQGYWTRTLTAVGAGTIVLSGVGVAWFGMKAYFPKDTLLYWQVAMVVVILGSVGALLYWLVGRKQNIVDFMIATEAEMKKVNWPTRKEIVGSTWVVIAGTFLIALILFLIDIFFGFSFTRIGILGR